MTINLIESTYRRLLAEGKNPIKLFSGNPSENGIFFPKEILEKCYRDFFAHQNYEPHPKGLLKAREAVSRFYQERNVAFDPQNILLTSGSSESFWHLFSLWEKSAQILVPRPTYPLFEHIAEHAGVELVSYPLLEEQGWKVDLEHLMAHTSSRTRAIVLVSPNNPTGSVVDRNQLDEIVLWANHQGLALICDEVFSEFYFGEGEFPRAAALEPELCFTLNGLSKMLALPAMKLSWMAVSGLPEKVAPLVDALETRTDTYLTVHTGIQEALPTLLEEGKDFLEGYKKEIKNRRDACVGALLAAPNSGVVPNMGARQAAPLQFAEPVGGFYLTAKINPEIWKKSDEDFVIELMEQKNIFVHPGYFFDLEDGTHFVISFLTETEKMIPALQAIKDFLCL